MNQTRGVRSTRGGVAPGRPPFAHHTFESARITLARDIIEACRPALEQQIGKLEEVHHDAAP